MDDLLPRKHLAKTTAEAHWLPAKQRSTDRLSLCLIKTKPLYEGIYTKGRSVRRLTNTSFCPALIILVLLKIPKSSSNASNNLIDNFKKF